jgi:methylenetetrahydrofolate reductase (NADPH)
MATPAEPLVADAGDARAATLAGELLANASLEVALREAGKLTEAAPLLPSGTCVYVPSLPARPLALSLPVLAAIRAQGLDPVPHVAARRVASHGELERFLTQAVREHGVHRVMLIGGDENESAGPWHDSVQLLASGVLRDTGVREIGIAAYPEGHPKIGQEALRRAFERKLELAHSQNLGSYIVTQFSFAPARIVALLADLATRAPSVPVYVGMPGPSDPLALLRYAQRCGVGATRRALSTLGSGIAHLVAHTDPSDQLAAAAHYAAAHENLVGVHLYSFGGVVRTAQWLHLRMQR